MTRDIPHPKKIHSTSPDTPRGSKHADELEQIADLVSRVMMDALTKTITVEQLAERYNVPAWMIRECLNTAIDMLRSVAGPLETTAVPVLSR